MNFFKDITTSGAAISNDPEFTFALLPAYAGYLLENKVAEMASRQHQLSKEWRIPLLRYFNHLPEARIIALGEENIRRVLTALKNNDTPNYIRSTVAAWVNDQIPQFSRNQLLSEDISLLSYIRRKVFREFVTGFTKDIDHLTGILEEVDRFISGMDRVMLKILFAIQQELHEQSQEIAHIGTWLWDLASNQIVWSKELFRIYELEPSEHVTYDIAVYNHPDDAPVVAEQMRISRETGQPHDFHYRVILPSGKEKCLHARGQVLTSDDGVAERMYGTLQDVTTQQQNEKANSEYKNFIQKITDLTPSLISVYNIKTGKYLFLNEAFETLLGYDPGLALDQGVNFFVNIIHPDDLPRILAENDTAVKMLNNTQALSKADQIREFRYRLRHANGEYRWFHTYGTIFERDGDNQVEKIINISSDITEQVTGKSLLHEKTEQIIRQEELHQKMIDEVEDYAIFSVTKDGLIDNWNKGAQKIKGYTPEEIIGQHLRIFYPKEDQDSGLPEAFLAKAAATGKASHEGWRIRKDGTRFWAYVVITALHDSAGELIGFSKVTRDLTDRKLDEERRKSYTRELEQKNKELEEKNKELESFTYIASHDLQEPLRKIKLWCNRLFEMDPLPDKIQSGLSRIYESSSKMQALIVGLLNYTQIDNADNAAELLDLNKILHELSEDFSERLQERQAAVTIGILPILRAVRLQIQQLFANLFSNSVKYAKTGVPLKINIEHALVSTGKQSPLTYHQITFADNGIGFNMDHATKIFEMFQRLDTSRNSGTGIGLAICKKIVEHHGGTISAVSEPGAGTTFYIRLPATD